MRLSDTQVAEYFEHLTAKEMRNNPAVTAAGRAFTRLMKTHVPGPGRPPTVEHRPAPARPRNWNQLSHREKMAWTVKNRAFCRCADCRRKHYPSYQHQKFGGVDHGTR